jgi:hypothetical protein
VKYCLFFINSREGAVAVVRIINCRFLTSDVFGNGQLKNVELYVIDANFTNSAKHAGVMDVIMVEIICGLNGNNKNI